MASNQRVQVVLGFQADTNEAKRAINDLSRSLESIKQVNLSSLGMDSEIRRAAEAARELQEHLQQAVNFNTGKLNLIDFNKSIKDSNQSLENLLVNLSNGGQEGVRAFQQLAQTIAQSEVPLRKTSELMSNVMTTLKNTAKWELSSKLIHGIESTFSGALSYVKDLDETLNNIRIVTGKSSDEMARFAIQANQMAQTLSTTTKAYAQASLIYFQQGDSQATAMQKAAITTKAANVAFTASAKEMSEMLTAVWNSYQVGNDQLEHTVDVMAALGARTASSMEEMATAMQKVAATANTVGVSMEQMSAIVATSASVTRQAPQNIGTAWNTILSRLSGLKLGETLEDGVDLNKYSKALASVGVEILDASGELRNMGAVIDELGGKWESLTVAQKSALAQTIGGVRQYTQLMAFFENFDKYQQNMQTANTSDGSLQQQADIFADSWEAASNRVRNSLENLYSSLINDKALIGLENTFNTVLQTVNNIVSSLGGISGVATSISSVLLAAFASKIPAGLKNIVNSVQGLLVDPKKQYRNALDEESSALSSAASANVGQQATINLTQQLIEKKKDLLSIEDSLSSVQAESMQRSLTLIGNQIGQVSQLEQSYNNLSTSIDTGMRSLERMATVSGSLEDYFKKANNAFQQMTFGSINQNEKLQGHWDPNKTYTSQLMQGFQTTTKIGVAAFTASNTTGMRQGNGVLDRNNWGTLSDVTDTNIEKITVLTNQIELLREATKGTKWENLFSGFDTGLLKTETDLQKVNLEVEEMKRKVTKAIGQMMPEVESETQAIETALRNAVDALPEGQLKTDLSTQLEDLKSMTIDSAEAWEQYKIKLQEIQGQLDQTGNRMQQLNSKFNNVTKSLGTLASAAGASLSVMRGFESATTAMASGTFSVSSALSTLVSIIPAVIVGVKAVQTAIQSAGQAMAATNWIIAIVSIVAMIGSALYGLFSGIDKAEKEANEKASKYSTQKYSNTSKETINDTDESIELIKNYNTLYDTYQRTGEGQEQLIESARKLADAYGLVGANVLLANGEFEKFNEQLIEQIGFEKQISKLKTMQSGLLGIIGGNEKGGIYSIDTNDTYKDARNKLDLDRQDYSFSQSRHNAQALLFSNNFYDGDLNSLLDFNESDNTYEINKAAILKWVDETAQGNLAVKEQLELEIINALFGESAQSVLSDNYSFEDLLNQYSESFNLKHNFYTRFAGKNTIISLERVKDLVSKGQETIREEVQTIFDDVTTDTEDIIDTLFDEQGFKWDRSSGQERIKMYKDIQKLIPKLEETIGQLTEEQGNITDEEAQQIIQQKIDYYKTLQKSLNEIFFDNIDQEDSLAAGLAQYIENERKIQQYTLSNQQIKKYIGKGEHDTAFKDFTQGYLAVVDSIETNILDLYKDEFEGLINEDVSAENGYTIKEGMKDAFDKEVTKLSDEFFNSVTAFGNYSSIFSSLRYAGLTDHTNDISELIAERDLTMTDFTSTLITAIKNFYRRVKEGSIVDDEYISNLIDEQKERAGFEKAESKLQILSTASSKLKSGISISDAQNIQDIFNDEDFVEIYNTYAQEINENALISFESFLELDKDAKEQYLNKVNKNYSEALAQAAAKSEKATNLQQQAQAGISAITNDLFDQNGVFDANRAALYRSGIQQFNTLYKKQDDGSYLSSTGKTFRSQRTAYWDFIGENGEGHNLFGDMLFDDFNLLDQYISNYMSATNDIEANNALANALALVSSMAKDASDNIATVTQAFNSLPTSVTEMDSLIGALKESGAKYQIKDSSGSVIALRDYEASDLLKMSDSQREVAMIEAQRVLVKNATGTRQILAQNELDKMEKTHAKNDRDRELRDETETLSQLKIEAQALSQIDLAKAPKVGTQAYAALNKQLKDMSKYANADQMTRIGLLGDAKRSNLQQQIEQQTAIGDKYYKNGFTMDQTTWKDDKEYEEWQKWKEIQQAILDLQDQITQTYENESKQRVEIINKEAEAIEKRLAQAQKEADKLKEQAQTFANAVQTGELSAVNKIGLSDADLQIWNNLTSAEERAAFAAQKWSAAIAKGQKVYEEQQAQLNQAMVSTYSYSNNTTWSQYIGKKQIASESDFIDTFGNNPQMLKAYQKAISDKEIDETSSASQVLEAVRKQLRLMGKEGEEAYKQIKATGIDCMKSIYDAQAQASSEAAKQEIERWKSAFQAIANIRNAILGGTTGNLSEEDWMKGYLLSGLSPEEYEVALRSGDLSKFELPEYNSEAYLRSIGFNQAMITEEGSGVTDRNLTGQEMINREVKRLMSSNANLNEEDAKKQAESNVKSALTNLLTNYADIFGITNTNEIPDLISKYLTSGLGIIGNKDISSIIRTLIAGDEHYNTVNRPQQEARTEAQTEYNKTITDQQTKIDEADEAIAKAEEYKNAAYQLAEDMGEKTITETMSGFEMTNDNFVDKVNEIMQTNYEEIGDIPANVLRDFASTMAENADSNINTKIEAVQNSLIAAEKLKQELENSNGTNEEIREAQENIDKYQEQLESLTNASEKAQDQNFQDYLESMAKEAKITAKELKEYSDQLVENGTILNTLSEKDQVKYAKGLKRLYNGFTTAKDHLKEYTKELKKNAKDVDAYSKTLEKMRDMYADIFDYDANQAGKLSKEFLESAENAELLNKAAEGNEEAFDKLTMAAAKDLTIGVTIDNQAEQDIADLFADIQAQIDAVPDLQVGADLDDMPFYNKLNQMIFASQEAASSMCDALSAIGVDAEIEEHTVTVPKAQVQFLPSGQMQIPIVDAEGHITYQTATPTGSMQVDSDQVEMKYYTIKGAKYNGKGVTHGGSGGNKSGGGGGGAKKHEQDKKAPERYHQISRALSAQQDLLNKNDKLKSRKYGTSYIDGLTKENTLLKEQIKLNEQKLKEAQGYLASDRAELASYGATFDAQGNVDFYAYQKKWDDWITSQGLKEMEEEEWKKVEKEYEKAMDALKNYEEAQDTIREQEQAILEAQNQISSNLKEAAIHKMEIKVDLNDRELKLLEHLIKRYEKDLKKQADNYGYMMAESNEYLENLTVTEEALNDLMTGAGLSSLEDINSVVNGMLNGGSMSISDFENGLDQMYDQIMDDLDALVELRENLLDFYSNVIEKGEEEISHWTNTLSHHINMMEKYLTILNLISDGTDYAKQNEILTNEYEIGVRQIEAEQNKLEMYYDQRTQLEEMLYNADGSINEKAEGDLKALNEQIQETEETIVDNAQKTMETVKSIYENTINDLYDDLNRLATSSNESLDWIKQTKWDWWKEDQDRFVDAITQVYEIDKLTRKIEDSIAKDRSKYNQEQLKALEDEINLRAQNNALTEYDIKMMEYSYELLLAKQNLENVQNAKDTVRLTRDENGNMIYQYSADQDKISEAQQKYNDVLYEMNQTTEERYRDLMETLMSMEQEMSDTIRQIWLDNSLTEEEKLAHIEEVKKRYAEQIAIIQDQLNISTENMMANQTAFSERFSKNLIDTTGKTQEQMNIELGQMMTDASTWAKHVDEKTKQAAEAAETYQIRLEAVARASETTWEGLQKKMQDFQTESQNAKKEAEKTTAELKKQLNQINALTASWQTFDSKLQASINKFENLATKINNATSELQKLIDKTNTYNNLSNSTSNNNGNNNNGNNNNGNGNNGNNNNNNNGNNNNNDKTYNVTYTAQYGKTVNGHFQILGSVTGKGSNKNLETAKSWAYRDASEQVGYGLQIVNGGYFYKSGGLADFTGPAWLDGSKQKPEYILNAEQTEQMFGILNSNTITRLLDTMTMATQAMIAGLGMTTSGNIMNRNISNSSHAEGNYYITANFPDAKDHNEIELALKNLMNYSSQQFNSLTL